MTPTHKKPATKEDLLTHPKTARKTLAGLGTHSTPTQNNTDENGQGGADDAGEKNVAVKKAPPGGKKENKKKRKTGQISDDAESISSSQTPKKARVIKPPRQPTTILRQFNTAHYLHYNPTLKHVGPKVEGKFTKFSAYDAYYLFIDDSVTLMNFKAKVPISGVRLDDRTAALALLLHDAKKLHENWPAEFDAAGMIRATRMPLGSAFKKLRKVGEVDLDGKVVEEEAYYYQWWKGLHCLMGQEGADQDLYMIRPSWETFRCEEFGFKITHKAVIQASSGNYKGKLS